MHTYRAGLRATLRYGQTLAVPHSLFIYIGHYRFLSNFPHRLLLGHPLHLLLRHIVVASVYGEQDRASPPSLSISPLLPISAPSHLYLSSRRLANHSVLSSRARWRSTRRRFTGSLSYRRRCGTWTASSGRTTPSTKDLNMQETL